MSQMLALIKRHEGFSQFAYKDSVGKITIGYGRNIEDLGITENEAESLVINDIVRVQNELFDNFSWYMPLGEVRRDAIGDMLFCLGLTKFREFHLMIQAMETFDFERAANEVLNSKWASQVGKRANEIAEMIRTGRYPSIL